MKDVAMTNTEKVRVMLPHWLEHNQGHGTEFLRWAEMLAAEAPDLAALLRRAAESLQAAQQSLEEALTKAGGPLATPGHSHSCEHHHHHH
ncbi:hypothetical protein [Candidatus Electronema sp. PJ]|uniref:hypothetical protein n=1 Tax=Candidatus Electronema sp. PJ TaxID=3401572 RepID=UPI003AA84307